MNESLLILTHSFGGHTDRSVIDLLLYWRHWTDRLFPPMLTCSFEHVDVSSPIVKRTARCRYSGRSSKAAALPVPYLLTLSQCSFQYRRYGRFIGTRSRFNLVIWSWTGFFKVLQSPVLEKPHLLTPVLYHWKGVQSAADFSVRTRDCYCSGPMGCLCRACSLLAWVAKWKFVVTCVCVFCLSWSEWCEWMLFMLPVSCQHWP